MVFYYSSSKFDQFAPHHHHHHTPILFFEGLNKFVVLMSTNRKPCPVKRASRPTDTKQVSFPFQLHMGALSGLPDLVLLAGCWFQSVLFPVGYLSPS